VQLENADDGLCLTENGLKVGFSFLMLFFLFISMSSL
jgi:hypothetical protein